MPLKVKSVAITDYPSGIINIRDEHGLKPSRDFSTRLVGGNVSELNVAVDLQFNGDLMATMPGQITVEVRTYEPKARRAGKDALVAPFRMLLNPGSEACQYTGCVSVDRLGSFLKPERSPEVAPVVREGGTSDRPEATPLFLSGGVEVLEVRVPPGNGVECGDDCTVWAYMRSRASFLI